jgi:glutamate-5-semialdehyde dehydrogenase
MNKKIETQLKKAKEASRTLGLLSGTQKNAILKNISTGLLENKALILKANAKDLKKAGANHPLLDRLLLNEARIEGMAKEIESLIKMPDPIGEIFDCRENEGLKICRKRVPLGVIGIIYESRPNVTTDVAAICIKSGNAAVLKGGKEARESYIVLHKIIKVALKKAGAPIEAVQFIDPEIKNGAESLIKAHGLIDIIIPRGSAGLINWVRENSTVPVIETGAGVCHIFVDESAKLDLASKIIFNAKTQRPSVCNALDTLIVHKNIIKEFLPETAKLLKEKNVEIFADTDSFNILKNHYPKNLLKKSTAASYGHEFLSQKMSIKTVKKIDEAIAFISKYSSKHSESILSENKQNQERFLNEVDAAVVYTNASTRFSDGACFGLGAEIGISNDKIHARGPMGPNEMTTYKWVVRGEYNTRK